MTVLGNDLSKANLDNDSDNAGQARAELESAIDAVNGILGAIGDVHVATVTGAGQTLDLGAINAGTVYVNNGGSGEITSFGTPSNRTEYKILHLAASISIINSSSLLCPLGANNISTDDGDVVLVIWDDDNSRWEILGLWPRQAQISTYAQTKAGSGLNRLVTTDGLWNAVLSDVVAQASTITLDMHDGPNFTLDPMTANQTLGAPSNQREGQSGRITVPQDGSGGRTLSYNSVWTGADGDVPTLSTPANAIDTLYYDVRAASGSDSIVLSQIPNITGL